jgi:hypothetical protein
MPRIQFKERLWEDITPWEGAAKPKKSAKKSIRKSRSARAFIMKGTPRYNSILSKKSKSQAKPTLKFRHLARHSLAKNDILARNNIVVPTQAEMAKGKDITVRLKYSNSNRQNELSMHQSSSSNQ